MLAEADLFPFRPPASGGSIRYFLRNFIESLPQSTYDEGFTRVSTPFFNTVFLTDPYAIEDMFVERPDLFPRDAGSRRQLRALMGGTALVTAEGENWRWRRRALAPAFTPQETLWRVPAFEAAAQRLALEWSEADLSEPVDAGAAMGLLTLDIIVDAVLGGRRGVHLQRWRDALTAAFAPANWIMLYCMLPAPRWLPHPGRRAYREALTWLHGETQRLARDRRAAPGDCGAIIDILFGPADPEMGGCLSSDEVAADLFCLLNAGHETSAVALTWTLWLLAQHQEAQEQVAWEARALTGGGPIQAYHLDRLTYTRQVIQESMRLFPPVAALSRAAKVNTRLAGEPVKAGAPIITPLFALHRHSRLWRNPHAFDPARFTAAETAARPRCAYMPFGAGPRVCLGANFAMVEMTVVLATLTRAFRFRTVPGAPPPRPVARMTLRPEGGTPLLLEPRR